MTGAIDSKTTLELWASSLAGCERVRMRPLFTQGAGWAGRQRVSFLDGAFLGR